MATAHALTWRLLIGALALAMLATGCPSDDDGGGGDDPPFTLSSRTAPPIATTRPTTTTSVATLAERLLGLARTNAPASNVGRTDLERILEQFRLGTPQSAAIASRLRAINGSWTITGSQIDHFARTWCSSSDQSATQGLLDSVPGAQLSAFSTLIDALGRIEASCTPRLAAYDEATNLVFSTLVRNTNLASFRTQLLTPGTTGRATTTTAPPSALRQNVIKVGCAAVETGIGTVIGDAVRRRTAGFALGLMIGLMFDGCPNTVAAYIR